MSNHLSDDLLTGAVDGTLAPADRDPVEAHLRSCVRCRREAETAARARSVLEALPAELTPPVDIAAAVVAAAGGTAPHPAAAPRWYRAAGLAAAAAAIALAVFTAPHLAQDEGPSDTTAALGAAPQEAGVSAVGQEGQGAFAVPTLETVTTDFDHDSLAALAHERQRATATPSLDVGSSIPTMAAASPADEAMACLLAGSAGQIAPDDRVERLLAATFEGTPAYIGLVVTGPADDAPDVRVIAVASDGCRLLDAA